MQGQFREDLYYRINVIELRVPPLRERSRRHRRDRRGDPAAARRGARARRLPELSAEAVQFLETYPFPGNVRQLENVLERALTLSTGGIAHAGTHPACVPPRAHPRRKSPAAAPSWRKPAAVPSSASQLEGIERDAIIKALEKTRYNKTAAAKLLGMSFRALRYRINKLGIE